MLLGNKSDLEEERKITKEVGANFAAEKGFLFMETSCLKNEHVAYCFETLIELICGEFTKNSFKNKINVDDKQSYLQISTLEKVHKQIHKLAITYFHLSK